MSRSLERAYDIIVRGDEVFSADRLDQFQIKDATSPDLALVTNGTGGFKYVPMGSGGGTQLPAPSGDYDALTIDPAGVTKWGGKISAGSF
jgi:hypothetical protein